VSRPDFTPFPKIPRLRRTIIVTEKIDGTNAQVVITPEGEVFAGSRNRWITPENDNYGFARWVKDHEEELKAGLGIGQHFGEWWGAGIQRGYGLSGITKPNKRFSLFNTHRWSRKEGMPETHPPLCCDVVPVLYIGQYGDGAIQAVLDNLREKGSVAMPGFMQPEGVVVYMQSSGTMHKILLEGDELPKGFLVKAERDRGEVAVVTEP
jgi:hypothetical protein